MEDGFLDLDLDKNSEINQCRHYVFLYSLLVQITINVLRLTKASSKNFSWRFTLRPTARQKNFIGKSLNSLCQVKYFTQLYQRTFNK